MTAGGSGRAIAHTYRTPSPPMMKAPPIHVLGGTFSPQSKNTQTGFVIGSISVKSAASCVETIRSERAKIT